MSFHLELTTERPGVVTGLVKWLCLIKNNTLQIFQAKYSNLR